MMIDRAIIEIMSNKPHKIRKEWIQDKADKLKGINTANKNLRVSLLIDRLNEKLLKKK